MKSGRTMTKAETNRRKIDVRSLSRLMFTFAFSSLLAVLYPAISPSPLPMAMTMLIIKVTEAMMSVIVAIPYQIRSRTSFMRLSMVPL